MADGSRQQPGQPEPWELAWLQWARGVVRTKDDQLEHFAWCQKRLGIGAYLHDEASDPASGPDLRWPGYVGNSWKPGAGVLFLGSVHSDFTKLNGGAGSDARLADVRRLADAIRDYASRNADDTEAGSRFLAASRQGYTALAPGWTRGRVLGAVLDAVMPEATPAEGFARSAWTNLAHCRARPRHTPGGEYPLQRACSGRAGAFPIDALIGTIWPAAILVPISPFQGSQARYYDIVPPEPALPRPAGVADPLVVAFNGSTYQGKAGVWQGRPPGEWIPEVAEEIRHRQAQHG